VATREPVNTSERLAEELSSWEERLAILQATYEKFFSGIERRPPDRERKQVADAIRRLKSSNPKNTGLRFRSQSLFAKLLSYERMWDRTLREMEEGTYRRDLFKARMRMRAQRPDAVEGSARTAAAAASTPPPASPGISEDNMKRLYATYLKAREQTGESTAGMTFESVASKIRAQVPQLMQKHAKGVDFKVVIKGGKAVLRAVPKV
jgi:hypothetical protein